MQRRFALFMLLGACGATPPAAAPTPPPVVTPLAPPPVAGPRPPERLKLTVLSASVDGRKPDGAAWDEDSAALAPPAVRGSLAAYLAAHRELEGVTHLLGEPLDLPGVLSAARKSSGPDPMVFVEVAGTAFRTTLAPGQFQPVWRFPVVFSVSPDANEVLRITVVDWDGPGQADVIGDKV